MSKLITPDIHNIARIAAQGLCTGCGVCAAICPSGALSMSLNKEGEYVPVLGDGCTECNLCYKVCPQLAKDTVHRKRHNLLSIAPEALMGSHENLTTWAGYVLDPRQRLQSSSGGLLTLVLQFLFDTHKIDSAIVVAPANLDTGPLFESRLVRSTEELHSCAGSKYYPTEISKSLRELESTKEKAAFVGLPCHINGVRAIMNHSHSLREQILYIFGLVCGHGVSTIFTDLLCVAAGISLNIADQVVYRRKEGSSDASDYFFSVFRSGKKLGKSLSFNKSLYRTAWVRRIFVPRACKFCTDCFAENADATFMDAWLPEYVNDPQGTSLVIARNSHVSQILQHLGDTNLASVWKVPPANVVRSQAGTIRYKRELLPSRVYAAVSRGQAVPDQLRCLAAKGTREQQKENAWHERYDRIARFVWRLHLPTYVRLRIIIAITCPSFIYSSKLLLKRILGHKGTTLVKRMLILGKHGMRRTRRQDVPRRHRNL